MIKWPIIFKNSYLPQPCSDFSPQSSLWLKCGICWWCHVRPPQTHCSPTVCGFQPLKEIWFLHRCHFIELQKRKHVTFGRGTQLPRGLPLFLQWDITVPGSVPSPLWVQRRPFCEVYFVNVNMTCKACVNTLPVWLGIVCFRGFVSMWLL